MTVTLTEWNARGRRYVPSRITMHSEMAAAFIAWHRQQEDSVGWTATYCALDCGAGVAVRGSELRLHRGCWNRQRLDRLAKLIGYAREQVVCR